MGLQNLYHANSLQNLIMKICAYISQIPNFGFDARSVPIILEHSNFYPNAFTPIHILFKVLRKFLRKKRSFNTLCRFLILPPSCSLPPLARSQNRQVAATPLLLVLFKLTSSLSFGIQTCLLKE